MKMKVSYFENIVQFFDNKVSCIEILNKKYFYRFIEDLNIISNSESTERVIFYNQDNEELNLNNKVKIIIDYFDFEFDSKKYNTELTKYIINSVEEDEVRQIIRLNKKTLDFYDKILKKLDIPLSISDDNTFDSTVKKIKLKINKNDDLLDNILTLIDLEKLFNINKMFIFVNLKQYLTCEELEEVYKYLIYNSMYAVFVDSQSYKKNTYETKIIIDENLDESVI